MYMQKHPEVAGQMQEDRLELTRKASKLSKDRCDRLYILQSCGGTAG